MSEKKLELQNVTFLGAEKRAILRGFSTSVSRGEIHALLGRYNPDVFGVWEAFSDKTLQMESGAIIYEGGAIPFKKMWKKPIIRLDGPENVFPQYSVMDNIFICQSGYYRMFRRARLREFQRLTERFALALPPDELVNNIPNEWNTMIALLRIAVESPDYCVLYDVLNQLSGNAEMMERGKKIIRTLRDEYGIGILYLTTRYEDAIATADRITVLVDGRINGTFVRSEFREDAQPLLYCLSGWTSMREQDGAEKRSTENALRTMMEMRSASESVEEIRNVLHYIAKSTKELVAAETCAVYVFDHGMQIAMNVGDEVELGADVREALTDSKGKLKKSATIYDERRNRTVILESALVRGEPACLFYTSYKGIVVDTEERIRILEMMTREALIAIETYHSSSSSLLLRETHHRIKNNLQIIINLLYMQQINLEELYGKEAFDTLDKLIYQIKSIALVHDLLTSDQKGGNIVNLRAIIERIIEFYTSARIGFSTEIDDFNIPYDKAATVSLLINEIISNSIKHAFGNQEKPHIRILCRAGEAELTIVVADNGDGFPEAILREGQKETSAGMELVQTIAKGLGGTVSLRNDGGAVIEITIPNKYIYEVRYTGTGG